MPKLNRFVSNSRNVHQTEKTEYAVKIIFKLFFDSTLINLFEIIPNRSIAGNDTTNPYMIRKRINGHDPKISLVFEELMTTPKEISNKKGDNIIV